MRTPSQPAADHARKVVILPTDYEAARARPERRPDRQRCEHG